MRDHPIIFSAPMVLALLAGRKTQTRRLAWRQSERLDENGVPIEVETPWRRVKPGDRLWVREAVWLPPPQDEISESDLRCGADTWEPSYHADGPDEYVEDYRRWGWKSRPSIHMPRWASRLTLTVTDVRVQRLQEISEADARAEGIEQTPCGNWRSYEVYPDGRPHPHAVAPNRSPVTSFSELWNSLHGPDAWAANLEVVALTFTVEQRNIDADA